MPTRTDDSDRIVLSDEDIEQLEELAAHLTLEQAGDFFGMGRETFRRVLLRQPRVMQAWQRGRAQAIKENAERLQGAIGKRNLTALIFWLKAQAGWRDRDQPEQTRVGGINIQINAPGPPPGLLKDPEARYAQLEDEHQERIGREVEVEPLGPPMTKATEESTQATDPAPEEETTDDWMTDRDRRRGNKQKPKPTDKPKPPPRLQDMLASVRRLPAAKRAAIQKEAEKDLDPDRADET